LCFGKKYKIQIKSFEGKKKQKLGINVQSTSSNVGPLFALSP